MKRSIINLAASLGIILGTAVAVSAETPGTLPAGGHGGRGAAEHITPNPGEVAQLQQAFNLLVGADHDYQGHRVKAMEAIARACRLMGTDIVPPGLKERLENAGASRGAATRPVRSPTTKPHGDKEPEPQNVSDQQLKQAQTIVQQVLAGIPAGTQPRISELLTKANDELTTALGIK